MNVARLVMIVLLAMSTTSYAQFQGHNSAEHHRQWNPQHQGYDGSRSQNYSGQIIHIPNQVWINYHGALASNSRGNAGISENARSLRAARREALRNCGARDCKIKAYATNGCLAAAFDGRQSAVGAAATKEEAEQRALNHCQADGSTCQIDYSHCNHPVRIR